VVHGKQHEMQRREGAAAKVMQTKDGVGFIAVSVFLDAQHLLLPV